MRRGGHVETRKAGVALGDAQVAWLEIMAPLSRQIRGAATDSFV